MIPTVVSTLEITVSSLPTFALETDRRYLSILCKVSQSKELIVDGLDTQLLQ